MLLTQFDYYRRYEAVLADLKLQTNVVAFQVENNTRIPSPDSIHSVQRVVQHVSWAPVIVRFNWMEGRP